MFALVSVTLSVNQFPATSSPLPLEALCGALHLHVWSTARSPRCEGLCYFPDGCQRCSLCLASPLARFLHQGEAAHLIWSCGCAGPPCKHGDWLASNWLGNCPQATAAAQMQAEMSGVARCQCWKSRNNFQLPISCALEGLLEGKVWYWTAGRLYLLFVM